MAQKTHSGRFKPRNPQKYAGDVNNIIYRSSWELKFLRYLDQNPNVISYASEELAIPYISPVDGKKHRYFPDMVAKVRTPDGSTKTIMIEIKPYSQTKHPVLTEGKRMKTHLMDVARFGVNTAKWKAAREFCADRQWEFQIMTEKELNIK
jgi:hypothetical protein